MRLLWVKLLLLTCSCAIIDKSVSITVQKTLPVHIKRGAPEQERVYVMLHHSSTGISSQYSNIIVASLRSKGYGIVSHYNMATLVLDVDFQSFTSSSREALEDIKQRSLCASVTIPGIDEAQTKMDTRKGGGSMSPIFTPKALTGATLGSVVGFLIAGIPGSIAGGLLSGSIVGANFLNFTTVRNYIGFIDIKISQSIGKAAETKYKSLFHTPTHTKEIFYDTKEKWIDHRTGLVVGVSGRRLSEADAAKVLYENAAVSIAEIL